MARPRVSLRLQGLQFTQASPPRWGELNLPFFWSTKLVFPCPVGSRWPPALWSFQRPGTSRRN